MATCLLFVCTSLLTILLQVYTVQGLSTVTSGVFVQPTPATPNQTVTDGVSTTTSSITTNSATTTSSESPLERHLALIIGVPTGIGLSVIGLSLCLIWLACSSYCEYRRSQPQLGNTASAGTRSTNVHANIANSNSKSTTIPMKQVSTSATESHAFQPEPDPEPEPEPGPGLESGVAPELESNLEVNSASEEEVDDRTLSEVKQETR